LWPGGGGGSEACDIYLEAGGQWKGWDLYIWRGGETVMNVHLHAECWRACNKRIITSSVETTAGT
jgi:hypothetical protein